MTIIVIPFAPARLEQARLPASRTSTASALGWYYVADCATVAEVARLVDLESVVL